jgi:hypothetical protein
MAMLDNNTSINMLAMRVNPRILDVALLIDGKLLKCLPLLT